MSTQPRRAFQFDSIARHPWWTALGVLVLLIVLLVIFWDWNWLKGPVERQVESRTGRTFTIAGDLDVDLGRVTTIHADRLSFGNATWAKDPTMASTDRLDLKIRVWPLLRGKIVIPEIRLTKPDIRLETGKQDGNWVFGDQSESGESPTIRALWVDDGRFRFTDAANKTAIDVKVASEASAKAGAAPPIRIDGGGRWSGNTFTIGGTAQSPLDLQSSDTPYRIDLRAAAGATRAHARGDLVNPFQLQNFAVRFALSGSNLADLYPLVGVALPLTPPYALDGQLGHAGKTWSYEKFTGKVGNSDLSGSANVALGGTRPRLTARLVSNRLDFDDLAGFLGGAPSDEGKQGSNPEAKAIAAKQAAAGRVLPETPYELDKLRSMDADVTLKAERINAPGLPLDDMDAHLFLDDGVLRLDPLNFGVADGDVRSTVRMNARESTIRTKLDMTAKNVKLGKLMPDAKLTESAVGSIGGRIVLDGRGNSIAKMFGSADGDIALGMGKGKISHLLVELAGIDIFQSLKYLIGKDEQIPIRCAFGDFGVKDGLMTSRALAFDTTDTLIIGDGTINLADEQLDLTLKPRPKDRTILSLRSPLKIGGTFADPSFRPDLASLGVRGAIALALATIAPPAALLATIDLGEGPEQADCGGKYAK